MTVLTAEQVAGYAYTAGFRGDDLAMCIDVSKHESGWKTDAKGDVAIQTATWGPSIGLMQIRSLKAQKGTGGQRDEDANLDPATNMAHAHELFVTSGWRPWSTRLMSSPAPFRDVAARVEAAGVGAPGPAAPPPGSSSGSSTTSPTGTPVGLNPIPGILDLLGVGAGDIRKLGIIFAGSTLGLVLVALGAVRMVAPTVRRVASDVEKVAPLAAAVA